MSCERCGPLYRIRYETSLIVSSARHPSSIPQGAFHLLVRCCFFCRGLLKQRLSLGGTSTLLLSSSLLNPLSSNLLLVSVIDSGRLTLASTPATAAALFSGGRNREQRLTLASPPARHTGNGNESLCRRRPVRVSTPAPGGRSPGSRSSPAGWLTAKHARASCCRARVSTSRPGNQRRWNQRRWNQ